MSAAVDGPPADLAYWVGFQLIPGIGPARIARLREVFGDLARAWRAEALELARAGLDARLHATVVERRRQIDPAAALGEAERRGVSVIASVDPRYPERLRQIDAAPALLYVLGDPTALGGSVVALVGTRRPTAYGRQVAETLARELAGAGVTVASGLARGIDSVAHRTVVDSGGITVAVLGSGVDVIYPPENARLARQIRERGAVVSELPLGTEPEPGNFPARNRIISGLSLGVVVVEAGATSGALITAGSAADQGRDVFAVPGPITSLASVGANRLIRDGAKLVTCANDVHEEVDLGRVAHQLHMQELLPENDTEATLLRALSAQPVHVDEICRATGLPVAAVNAALAMLELKGHVRQAGGMSYVLARY